MGMGLIKIDPDLLRQILVLPDTSKILDVWIDRGAFNLITLKVEDPNLPKGLPGNYLTVMNPQYETITGKPVFIGWR